MRGVTAFSLFVYCVLLFANGVSSVYVPERIVSSERPPAPSRALDKSRQIVNPVQDSSFESGDVWSDVSANYGWVRCDSTCMPAGSDFKAYNGEYYLFFGGTKKEEQATVSQTVEIPVGATHIKYWLNSAVQNFDSETVDSEGRSLVLQVYIDDSIVSEFSQSSHPANNVWTQQTASIPAQYADGESHVITIFFFSPATPQAESPLANFYVDLVTIISSFTTGLTTGVTTGALTTGVTTGLTTGVTTGPVYRPHTVCYKFDDLYTNARFFSKARVVISDCNSKSRDKCQKVETINFVAEALEKQHICIPPVSCSEKNAKKFGGSCVRVYDIQVDHPSENCKDPITPVYVPLNAESYPNFGWYTVCTEPESINTGSSNHANSVPVFGICSASKGEFCSRSA